MALFFKVLQAVFSVCVLQATAQDNPFGANSAAAAEAAVEPPTTAAQPEVVEQAAAAPAAGRRLGPDDPISDLTFGLKDTNGTDMRDGETPDVFSLSMTLPSAAHAEAIVKVPSNVFTANFAISMSDVTVGSRRLQEGGVDEYGRRLAACSVASASVVDCSSTSLGGTGRCLKLGLGGGTCNSVSVELSNLASTYSAYVSPNLAAANVEVSVRLFDGTGNPTSATAAAVFSVLSQAGVAISDPITFYKGKKTKFWLPVEGEHLLVQTADLAIYASVFQGPRTDLQWFDRFFIRLPDGRKIVEVGVKRESINQNNTASRHHRVFSQLDIKMGSSEVPLHKLQRTLFSFRDSAVKVGVGTQRYDPPRLHGQPVTEFVNVETPSISFVLVASHAGNEFPNNIELQKKHAHLDWITREMVGTKSFTGILPQIWGVQQPLSAQVAAMLQEPTAAAQICAEV